MKSMTLLAAAAICVMSLSPAFAQKATPKSGDGGTIPRIAIADMEKIAKEMPEAVEADKKLTEMRKKCLDTLQAIEQAYKEKVEAYQKGKNLMTPDAQKKEEDDLRGLQQRYVSFQEEKFGAAGELATSRDKLLRPILQKVQEAVQAVAKEEKYSFVFDKAASALLYAEEKADITYKVIDKLKRGEK